MVYIFMMLFSFGRMEKYPEISTKQSTPMQEILCIKARVPPTNKPLSADHDVIPPHSFKNQPLQCATSIINVATMRNNSILDSRSFTSSFSFFQL